MLSSTTTIEPDRAWSRRYRVRRGEHRDQPAMRNCGKLWRQGDIQPPRVSMSCTFTLS